MSSSPAARELTAAQLARNKLGGRTANGASPEAIAEARQEMAELKAERAIAEEIAKAPPLSEDQRRKLASILLSS